MTKTVTLFTSLLLFVTACARVDVAPGPDPDCPLPAEEPPAPAIPAYGLRLGPYGVTYEDGTAVHDSAWLFDHERGEPCRFMRIEGAPARCLPEFVWMAKPGWYADPECTQPVAIVDACAELPRYVRDESAKPWEVCAPAPLDALYPLAPPLLGDVLYTHDPLGNCVEKAGTLGAPNVAMPLGAPIPMSAFVAGAAGPQ